MRCTITLLFVLWVSVSGWAQEKPSSLIVTHKDYFIKQAGKKKKRTVIRIGVLNDAQSPPALLYLVDVVARLSYTDLPQFTYALEKKQLVFSRKRPPYNYSAGYYESGYLHIRDSCYFLRAKFRNSDFSRTVFEQEAHFGDCRFDRVIGFSYDTFQKKATFNGSTFTDAKSGSFESARFAKAATFFSTTFEQEANFADAYFADTTHFEHAIFKKKSNFNQIHSQAIMHMAKGQFRDTVSFNAAIFEKVVNFNNAYFRQLVSFDAAHFNDSPSFTDAQFPHIMDFRLVKFEPITKDTKLLVDLRTARLDSLRKQRDDPEAKCTLWLDGTDASPFIVPSDRFYITFADTTSYEARYNALETIIKNCRDAGMVESVEYWDVQYRELQNIHRLGWWGYVVNWFNYWWWNFGYDRYRILLWWLPGFFGCFLLYNYIRIKTLWTKMYKDPELGSNFREEWEDVNLNFKNRWQRFSFTFFYTAVIYFGFKLRHDSVNYNYTRGLLYSTLR